jgi:hypothetical protein
MGRKALSEIAIVAKPETILAWYRRLVAQKFDGSKQRKSIGRPLLAREVVDFVVRMFPEIASIDFASPADTRTPRLGGLWQNRDKSPREVRYQAALRPDIATVPSLKHSSAASLETVAVLGVYPMDCAEPRQKRR